MHLSSEDQTQLLARLRVTPYSFTWFSPWLSSCMEPLTALPLLRFFPTHWAQRCELVSELPAIIYEQHTSLSSLRPAPLSSLPQVPCGMDELEGQPRLARFSELGQQNCLLLPLLPVWWFCVCIRKSEGCMRFLHDGIYWYLLLFIVHKISDVPLLCRQFYTTEFAHGLTASAP